MILPSINAFNCGDILRAITTIPSSDETANRKSVMDWTIRRQATLKKVEASTTTKSSLSPFRDMVKFARMGRFILLAWFLVFASAFFASVVEANMGLNGHQGKILNPNPLISQEGKIKYSLNYQVTDRGQDKEPANNIMEIKGEGSKVIITTIPDVAITDYKKGEDTSTKWQNLSSPGVELVIDRAKMFAFKMDKIDIKQFAVKMMPKASDDAAQQMKIVIDADGLGNVYADAAAANKGLTAGRKSLSYNLGASGSPVVITKSNVLDYIIDCESVADEQNWPDSDRWIVIPTWMSGMIMKSDLKDASLTGDSTSIIRGGRIGQIGKWSIYVTNQYTIISDGGSCYPITFGHKSGLTFASQLVETEYFDKLESTFGSGMKGLNVYGFKVIKSEAIGYLYCKKG